MSKIFPSEVAEALRGNTDKMIEITGQTCRLKRLSSQTVDKLGDIQTNVYSEPVATYVQIHWSPEIRLLKALGLFVEDGRVLPILAYFKFSDDPKVGDLVEFDYEYSVGSIKTNKFQVVDRRVRGHDAEARAVWVIAPLRS